MAFIQIAVAEISVGIRSPTASTGSSMVLRGRLEGSGKITTPDERDLSNAAWEVQLVPMSQIAEAAKDASLIGVCSFSEKTDEPDYWKDESFYAHVGIEKIDLQLIYSAWASGKIVRTITIDVPDINYGWEPDGSRKIWDLGRNYCLISGATISVGDGKPSELQEIEMSQPMPAASSQSLIQIERLLSSIAARTRLILMAVVVGVIVAACFT
ncbi:hypothetical protein [Xanthomonas citri]|uniref:hypothetical protein n=2 Tax=Xanthomonas citri TaxID=346 RepID=UPI00103C968A|nr:hypothetical protein [Xanthomonas citri]